MRTRVAGLVCVVVLALGVGAVPVGAAPAKPFDVIEYSMTFTDTSRPTQPNGTYPGAKTRTLPVEILVPTRARHAANRHREFPLVVFAHGFGASGPIYEGLLLRSIAEAGYVVVAPTFPLTSMGTPGGPYLLDYLNQPDDVSFVISSMLGLDKAPGSPLHNRIDEDRIGVGGHSLGAITTLGFFNTCCKDPRIDAAVPISGIALSYANGQFFVGPTPPVLFIHGDQDGTVPYFGSVNAYNRAAAPKYLLTLVGAPHTPFFAPWRDPIVDTTIAFFDHYLKHPRRAIDPIVDAGNVPGVSTLQQTLR